MKDYNEPVSVGDWLLTYFISAIPIVGFIMFFVWAFGENTKPSKKTWAIANLIMFALVVILYALIIILLIGSGSKITDFINKLQMKY